jgi:SnoaL-like protein
MEHELDQGKDFSRAVQLFAAGWQTPGPHAWDDLLAADVELRQPMLRAGRGRSVWHEEIRRLLAFMPDLHGEVLSWAARGDTLFIDVELRGTAGGKPVSLHAVDRLTLADTATVVRRDSFFDPMPLAATLARRPRAWLPWWRSGVGPLLWRRKVLRKAGTP